MTFFQHCIGKFKHQRIRIRLNIIDRECPKRALTLQQHVIQDSEIVPNQQQSASCLLHLGSECHHYVMSLALWRKNRTSRRRLAGNLLFLIIYKGKGAGRFAEIDALNVVVVIEFREHVDDVVRFGIVVQEHWLHSDGIVGRIGYLNNLQLLGGVKHDNVMTLTNQEHVTHYAGSSGWGSICQMYVNVRVHVGYGSDKTNDMIYGTALLYIHLGYKTTRTGNSPLYLYTYLMRT